MNEIEILIAVGSDIRGINQVIEKHYEFPPIYFKPAPFSSPAEIEQSDQSITFKQKIVAK